MYIGNFLREDLNPGSLGKGEQAMPMRYKALDDMQIGNYGWGMGICVCCSQSAWAKPFYIGKGWKFYCLLGSIDCRYLRSL